MFLSDSENGFNLPPSTSGIPPYLQSQMPPGFSGLDLDPAKFAKSPFHSAKPSHSHDKESVQAQKSPSGSTDAVFDDGLIGVSNSFSTAAASNASSTNRKCRALYGFEQKDKWCKPCKNKKRCIQFM